MSRYVIFVVLWAAVMNITFQIDLSESEMRAMKGKFCGPHLPDMLSLVCDGVYNNKHKRNFFTNKINNREDYDDAEHIPYLEDSLLDFPFRSREQAKAIIPLHYRKRDDPNKIHGVADECCHKPCSLWEMSSYCGK